MPSLAADPCVVRPAVRLSTRPRSYDTAANGIGNSPVKIAVEFNIDALSLHLSILTLRCVHDIVIVYNSNEGTVERAARLLVWGLTPHPSTIYSEQWQKEETALSDCTG